MLVSIYTWIPVVVIGFVLSTILGLLCIFFDNKWRKLRILKTFDNKKVLITGASSGIGLDLAWKIADLNATVILAARSIERLNEIAESLRQHGKKAYCEYLDLNNLESIPEFCSKILSKHGPVDILINNAGVGFFGNCLELEQSVLSKVMNINFVGAAMLTKELAKPMVQRESGKIAIINSLLGKFSVPYWSAYSASKHASIAFFDALRAEIAHSGVKVIAICPGWVDTDLTQTAMTPEGAQLGVDSAILATGLTVDYLSIRVITALADNKTEVVIGSGKGWSSLPKFVELYRTLCQTRYFNSMKKRAMVKEV